MASTYRRKRGSDGAWHLCSNCSNWPTNDYEERSTPPANSRDRCTECVAKKNSGDCR